MKTILSCALSGVAANRAQCPGIPYTPEEYGEFVRVEVERWGKVMKASGAKAD